MTAKDDRLEGATAPALDANGSPQDSPGRALRERAEEITREEAARSAGKHATSSSPVDARVASPEEAGRTIHELRVHQVELELQNEELRRAQVELDTQRTRYFDLLELAPVGYCSISEPGLILDANLTLAALLGVIRSALIKQPLTRFILKEDQDVYYQHRKRLFATGEPRSCEVRMLKNDGSAFWARLEATTVQDGDGARVCLAWLSDISQRKLREEDLRGSEERYRTLVATAMDGFWLADMQGRLLEVNETYCRMSGFSEQELLTMRVQDLEAAETEDDIAARMKQLIEKGEDRFETRHRRKDGSVFDVGIGVQYRSLDGGRFVAFLRDITERKRAEEESRESKARLDLAVSSSGVGLWDWDLRANRVYYSSEWKRQIGYEVHEVSDEFHEWHDRVHPDDLERAVSTVNRFLKNPWPNFEQEFRFRHKDGSYRWILARGSLARDADGKPCRMLGAHLDITERKRAEDELRLFKAIFDTANFGAGIADLNGVLTYVNDSFAAVHGYEVGELLGQPLSRLHNAEQLEQVEPLLRKMLDEGNAGPLEVGHCHRDGSTFPMLETGTLIRDARGVPQYFAATAIDLAERKSLEAQLLQAQKMESVGRLAGGVAHDFNNMLGVILGHTELAQEQVDPALPIHADLEEIRKAAERSADLTRQLLAFARKQTVTPKVLDLNETVRSMLKMLRRLIGDDVDLRWQPSSDPWPIRMDPSQIDQILANLCINARDAIGGVGKITITTENRTLDEDYCAAHVGSIPGEYVILAVSDDGCGMDAATLTHIFEPFFTTKGVGVGTGLGLATVFGAVKQNNGFIEALSEPGQGATLAIYLPRYMGKADQVRTERTARPAVVRGHETILLVEDDPAILALIAKILEGQGYAVLVANTPGAAIRLAREHAGEIHLLMTDVVMPEMNGRDLARNLLSLYPSLSSLFMSGYTADIIAQHGIVDEGVHFIQKPFSMKDLAAKVRGALDCG